MLTRTANAANDDMGVVLIASFPRRVTVMGVVIDHQVYSAGKGIFAFAAAVYANGNWAYHAPYYNLEDLRQALFVIQTQGKGA